MMTSRWSLGKQRKVVKSDLAGQLDAHQRWEPVPTGWFNEWKKYVDFDSTAEEDARDLEVIESLHPGQIDLTGLKGDFGDELSRELQIDVDYVLLRTETVDKMFEHYGSPDEDTRFGRNTKNAGTYEQPKWYIKLYPSRVEVSYYDADEGNISKGKQKDAYFYIYDKTDVKELLNELENKRYIGYNDTYQKRVRVWYKLKSTAGEAQSPSSSSSSSGLLTRGSGSTPLRYITKDSTSIVGGWKLLYTDNDVNCEFLLSERNCVEILIEKAAVLYPSDENWPMFEKMNAWKENLAPGDVIDVRRSKDNKWLEAIVKSIDKIRLADQGEDENFLLRSIEVHYKSFEASDDEVILKTDFKTKLAPLQSHTVNWKSTIEEDDLCDVKVDGIWVQGSIESIDNANNKVLVCYNKALVDHYKLNAVDNVAVVDTSSIVLSLSSVESSIASSDDNATSMDYDDDAKKKKKNSDSDDDWNNIDDWNISKSGGGGRSSMNSSYGYGVYGYSSYSKPKPALEKIIEPDIDSVPESAWFQLDAEDITYIQTHSKETHRSRKYLTAKSEATSTYYDYGDRATKGKPDAPGSVGLQNIGNTCYMNSLIQCLSHASPLTDIFTSGRYRQQLNRGNSIGFGGKLAKSYAQLIKDIHSDNFTTLVPRQFKKTIGECWQQFAGDLQQDSQELMTLLIEGLHEELNRIQKKPPVQTIRGNGRPDALIAADSWRRHLLRHDSEITDMMCSQLKSTVTCANADCRKEHVIFEPYSSLILPVPEDSSLQLMRIMVRLLPYNSTPFEVDVKFNVKTGTVARLKQAIIQRLVEIHCIGAEVASSLHFQLFCNTIGFNSYDFQDTDTDRALYYYNPRIDRYILMQTEFEAAPRESFREFNYKSYKYELKVPVDKKMSIMLFSSIKKKSDRALYSYSSMYDEKIEHLEIPVAFCYDATSTGRDIHRMIKGYARRFVPADFENMDELSTFYDVYLCNRYSATDEVLDDDTLFEPGYVVSLAIMWKQDFRPVMPSGKMELRGAPDIGDDGEESAGLSIYKCLDKFLEHEQLPEIETFYCNVCKQHLAPQKKLDIWATPDVLAISLKRFQFSTSQYGNVTSQKMTEHVDYPTRGLDLSRYIIGPKSEEAPPIYDLVGVSLHSGSLFSGHYTAVCRNETTGDFFNLNDSIVSKVSESAAVTDKAYVLIYKRRTGRLRWGGIRPTEGDEVLPDDP